MVIPKALREAIGLEPGDTVEFSLDNGEAVRVIPVRSWRLLEGAFDGHGLVEALQADRRAERARAAELGLRRP